MAEKPDPLFDHAQTSVMKRLGWEGWTVEQVQTLFKKLNIKGRDGGPVPEPTFGHVKNGQSLRKHNDKRSMPKSAWLIQAGEIASWRSVMNGAFDHAEEEVDNQQAELDQLEEEFYSLCEQCKEVERDIMDMEAELNIIQPATNQQKPQTTPEEVITSHSSTPSGPDITEFAAIVRRKLVYDFVDALNSLDEQDKVEFWRLLGHHHEVDWINLIAGMMSAGKINQINQLQGHLKKKFPHGDLP